MFFWSKSLKFQGTGNKKVSTGKEILVPINDFFWVIKTSSLSKLIGVLTLG